MIDASSSADSGPILISDFDGTMSRHDFYKLAIERLLPADTRDYWVDYRAGRITHFEALRRYFAEIRASEDEVLDVVRQMELDAGLPAAVDSFRKAGWQIIVVSAGCEWYIRKLLSAVNLDLTVHANPGDYEPGRGLIMELPTSSPFLSNDLGIDKSAIVRHYVDSARKVAFAGDGFPDVDAARLVSGDYRFARGDLAKVLRQERQEFHPFSSWSDIAQQLLQKSC